MSPQSKSFIILFIVSFFAVGVVLFLSKDLNSKRLNLGYFRASDSPQVADVQDTKIIPKIDPIDTADWPTYKNEKYGFSFKYKPGWTVKATGKKGEFEVLEVDPGPKYYNFKIYVNPQKFYIMDGLPTRSENISGLSAINVNNALYGIKANDEHLTFDVSWSMQLLSDFNAMVHTVQAQ